MNDKDYVNDKYFSLITDRERAIFEGAISMGALFHQFIGTPVNITTVKHLEKTIASSLELQPAIDSVEVKINLGNSDTDFDYTALDGDMLDVKIKSTFKDKTALIRMEFIEELNYPLMYVEDIN